MVAVVIGVDPHKRSNAALVLDPQEKVLARQRFTIDRDGHRELKRFARSWRYRTWAIEDARGVGSGLAQRLATEGETVLNVPAKLSARVRALGGGSGTALRTSHFPDPRTTTLRPASRPVSTHLTERGAVIRLPTNRPRVRLRP